MNRIYKSLIMAFSAIIMLTACGNATAKSDTEKTRSKAVKELDSKEFNAKVYDMSLKELAYLGDKPAIVDFTASWCGPCQRIAPILEELADEYKKDIVVYKVDIDKERGLA